MSDLFDAARPAPRKAKPVKALNLRFLPVAMLIAAVGLTACKKGSTYVHVKIEPASIGEPVAITRIELQLDLAGKTSTVNLSEPGNAPIQFPTDVTLEVKTGSGQLSITAICRNAAGQEVDRGVTTVEVKTGAIAQASVQLPGGKPDVQPVEASHEFGSVPQSGRSATINLGFKNVGFRPSGQLSIALGGAGATSWDRVTDTCNGSTLTPGATCTVGVQFHPGATGALAATLTASANPGGAPVVSLTGTGVPSQPITVTVTGTGTISDNQGNSCPNTASPCTFFEPQDGAIVLTAATADVSFGPIWSGDCTGTATCDLVASAPHAATATFTSFLVALTKVGAGAGTISSADGRIACDAACTSVSVGYPPGSNITLTAAPSPGVLFTGYSGCTTTDGKLSCAISAIAGDTAVTAPFVPSLCAGTVAYGQEFNAAIQGCPGTVAFADRATLCGAGTHVCNADEWVQNNVGVAPTHHYWSDDDLRWSSGTGPCGPAGCNTGSCFVSTGNTYTASCTGTPMRVCAGTGAGNVNDPEGNTCNWTGCGYNSITPNQFFGGCASDPSAGTLCCSDSVLHLHYVSAGSTNTTGPCTSATPCKTITKAVSLAVAGDTIHVAPGTYDTANGETFPIVVPARVSLIGDEPNRGNAASTPTKIVGCGGTPARAVTVGAGATIAGFTVTCSTQYGIVPSADRSIIRNNTVTSNGVWSIDIEQGTGHQVLLNAGSKSFSSLTAQPGPAGSVKVENNTFTNNVNYGIEIGGAAASVVDLGGGATGSVGNNILSCNPTADVGFFTTGGAVSAANNKWDHSGPTTSTTSAGNGIDVFTGSGGTTLTATNPGLSPTPCPACAATVPAASRQVFDGVMIGCGSVVAFASRATLCPSYCHACSAAEWNAHRSTIAPASNYWTGDTLLWNGAATGTCQVSATNAAFTNPCGGGSMLVCPDSPATRCQSSALQCGLDTVTNQHFGGCSQTTGGFGFADGTLCCCP